MKIDYVRYCGKCHPDMFDHHAAISTHDLWILSLHLSPPKNTPLPDTGCKLDLALRAWKEMGRTSVFGVAPDGSQGMAAKKRGRQVELQADAVVFSNDLLLWWEFCFFRLWRRLETIAELDPAQTRSVPFLPNLPIVAHN